MKVTLLFNYFCENILELTVYFQYLTNCLTQKMGVFIEKRQVFCSVSTYPSKMTAKHSITAGYRFWVGSSITSCRKILAACNSPLIPVSSSVSFSSYSKIFHIKSETTSYSDRINGKAYDESNRTSRELTARPDSICWLGSMLLLKRCLLSAKGSQGVTYILKA